MPRYREREDYGDATPTTFEQRQQIYRDIVEEKQRQQAQAQAQQEQKQATQRMQQKVYQMEEQRQRLGYYEKTAPPEFQESVRFYTELGYPKLAGKYAPFELPPGYAIREIKETPSGLEVAFIPSYYREEPKGIAETLAGFEVKPLLSYLGIKAPLPRTPMEFMEPKETTRPFAGIAGVIAPFESTAYLVRYVGIQTPRPPPTFISFELGRAMEYGPEYAGGTIMGDILLSLGFGKVGGKIWEHIPKIVKTPITKVAGTVAKPFRPITEPIMSKLEKWALWPYERIAPGVVSVPTGKIIPSHEVYGEIWGWGLTQKTSLLFTEKGFALSAKELPKWFIRGTAMVPMATRQLEAAYKSMPYGYAEPWKRVPSPISGGLPQPTITELFKPTITTMPYIQTVQLVKEPSHYGLASILRIGLTSIPKSKLKTTPTIISKLKPLPTLAPKLRFYEEPFSLFKMRLFPQLYSRQEQRERAIPILRLITIAGLEPLTKTVSAQKLEVPQMLKQEVLQIPRQIQKLTFPTPTIPKQIFEFPRMPSFPQFREPSIKKMNRGLFGKWFKREHAMPTEKQIMKQLGFTTKRRRTHKRKR